jgi:hypothetical protein
MVKKILKISGISILVLLLLLFLLPILFRGKIITLIKSQINENINAKADFADASVSLFRSFPRVSVGLDNLNIVGKGNFEGDTLINIGTADVALDLMSVIRGTKMKIHSIDIHNPRIYAIVMKDGTANWDIVKEDTVASTDTSSGSFNLELQRYAITDGFVSYVDSSAGIYTVIENLDHEGKGDFMSDRFTLETHTKAEGVNLTYGVIPYLSDATTRIDANLEIDNSQNKYSFKTDGISVNDLVIATEGFYQLVDDSTSRMDIKFNAPSTDFKKILSLIPAVYQKDFDKIKADGQALFNGVVKGTLSPSTMPAYDVNMKITNGSFQYPDLPTPLRNIQLAMNVSNPDGITDHTVVNIPSAHFEMDRDPFDFKLLVKNPVSDLWIDAMAKGRIDLSKLSRLVKLDAGTKLAGLLNANVTATGNVEAAQKQQFDKFQAAGTIDLQNFLYASKDYPQGVTLNKLLMAFNPQNVTINETSGKFMSTNFSANGSLNNLFGYALKNQPLVGQFNVKADQVNVNDFMGDTTSATTGQTTAAFIVPANLDIVLNAQADKVLYDKLNIENLKGTVQLDNETLRLNNVTGNALDGTIGMSGSYSTLANKKKPAITFQYDLKNLDVQKTFMAVNTVQKLMPIGKFLSGTLNSQMSMNGTLSESLLPDLATLAGNGNLFLIEGFLQKFKPLESLAERLNVDALRDVSLREVRQRFEFANGKVFVKPFTFKHKSIEMEIGGMHGLDQTLDYTINLKVPRELIGTKGNQLVNDLVSKATQRGVPLKVGETINFNVKMDGTIASPRINVNLKEAASSLTEDLKQQAKDFAQAKVDSTKKAVSDTIKAIKKEAVREASEKLTKEIFGKKDTARVDSANRPDTKTRAKEAAKGVIDNINPFRKKKTADSTKTN